MKKTLLLFTVLLFGLQGWATTFTVDGVTYTITDATNKTVAIGTGLYNQAAISTSTAGAFTIPSAVSYNGDSYTVTAIGDYAFFNCSAITSVTIPNTVTSIGYQAFLYCSKLASIIIPSTITLIKGNAFQYFNYSITVEDNNPNYSSLDGILYNKSKTTLIQCPCLKGQVTIPNTVTTIGNEAFDNNSKLTSITIPSSVTTIGDYAFYGCSYLTSVNIPASVTSIGGSAFVYSSLTSINIPSSVTSIGNSAFAGVPYSGSCVITVDKDNPNYSSLDNILYDKAQTKLIQCPTSETKINIPATVTTIGNDAFRYSKLTSITIPSSVKTIENDAFLWCGIKSISISASVVSIGFDAFEYCYGLTSITVDNNNPNYCSVDGVLFNKNKTTLIHYPIGNTQTSYSIPNTVSTVEMRAFENGSKLTSIVIPSSVTSIISYAFYHCTGLKTIYANSIDPKKITLGGEVFYSVPTSTCTLYIPTGSKSLYANADEWKAFANIVELPLYTITASVNTSTGGNVNGVGSFLSSNQCTISAVPNTGYSFANWTENGTVVSTDASYIFTVTADRTLVANFTENSASDYTITMNSNPSACGSTTGIGRYASGATCIASATANTGYIFSNWTENGTVVSKDATYTFAVSAARTLVANFIAGYTVTAVSNLSIGGSVTGTGDYAIGTNCTLTASANDGYLFSNWTENGIVASKKATFTFTVNAAHTFVANFVAGFIINATADASQGNITGTGGYATGTSCTLKATPKTGYVFTGWTDNGTVVSTNPSYTFAVNAARSLVANFSTVGVAVTQPTATTLSGSITVTPSTGFTYSIDGKTYQNSNEFPYVSIGTYNVTLKNVYDGTVSSPVLAVVNASGVVAANNYQIKATNCTCRDIKDGAIAIKLAKALDYTVYITGTNTDYKTAIMFSGTSYNLKNLPADTYKLVFKIDFLDNYEQSFNVVVTQPEDLSVLKVGAEKSRATYTLSGGTNYYVSLNDNTTETLGNNVEVSLVPGENRIKIYTEKLCQGVYEETIYNSENGQISLFPNPTSDKITIGIPGEEESVTVEVLSLSGALQLKQKLVVPQSRLVDLDVSYFISGTYIVKVNGSTLNSSVKMMKKQVRD